ncbi:MAG: hypothetical protein GX547_16375 [Phycisphaerae bacterium]|nr:hypothetical protein [Phycisphaerae bacterium]
MDWEILVVAEEMPGFSAQRGEAVVAREAGHRWSRAELSSRFARVPYTGTRAEVREICRGGYTWDFAREVFVHETGQDFTPAIVVAPEDADATLDCGLDAVADAVVPGWRGKGRSADSYRPLHPEHLPYPEGEDYSEIRRYWFDKFRWHCNEPGIRQVLAALKHHCGSLFAELGRRLPADTRRRILSDKRFTPEDVAWLKKVWRVKDGD